MIGKTNASSGGGFSSNKATIIIKAPTNSNITLKKGAEIKTAKEKNGTWIFSNLEYGPNIEWNVEATQENKKYSTSILTTESTIYYRIINYRNIPIFTYSGEYEVLDDNDKLIDNININSSPKFDAYQGDWKIKFKTSGDFRIIDNTNWNGKIDAFLVGGGGNGGLRSGGEGGCGGGGGRTKTISNIQLETSTIYPIEIGISSGTTRAFNQSADGGQQGTHTGSYGGGQGGNGGGGVGGNGGSGGIEGSKPTSEKPGKSLDQRTREFDLVNGKLYAGGGGGEGSSGGGAGGAGGGGSGNNKGIGGNGIPNTGGGGGAGLNGRGLGGSGVVIIRNLRGEKLDA